MKKITDRLVFTLFWCILLSFAALFWLLPDSAFSENENRSLTSFPHFRVQKLMDGRYTEEMHRYFSDQFPARDTFIGVKAMSELALGKGENNGILVGADARLARRLYSMRSSNGMMIANSDLYSRDHMRDAARRLASAAKNADVPTRILLPPRPIEVAADAFSYPTEGGEALQDILSDILTPTGAYIDLAPAFRKRTASGEDVYYRTDHHWTTAGAYHAYVAILHSFGMDADALPPDAFCVTAVTEDFRGTLWSASGMRHIPGEKMEIWYRGNEVEFTVTADGNEVPSGFYTMKYLAEKDKYSLFLDGTHDIVTIQKNTDPPRPTLLILKDSFANSVAPFLAQHFDLVLCNLSSARRDFTDLNALISAYDADCVLILYSVGNMVSTDVANRIH